MSMFLKNDLLKAAAQPIREEAYLKDLYLSDSAHRK